MILCIRQIDFSQMCQKLFEKKKTKQVENKQFGQQNLLQRRRNSLAYFFFQKISTHVPLHNIKIGLIRSKMVMLQNENLKNN